jgi:hypothetical protein
MQARSIAVAAFGECCSGESPNAKSVRRWKLGLHALILSPHLCNSDVRERVNVVL